MSINTKIRFTILTSALALAAAAPAAFADSGTWYHGFHTDAGGTPDAPAARHTQQVMNKKVASGSAPADTGTWNRGFHTDPNGTPDAPAGQHTLEVMQKAFAPSGPFSAVTPGLPAY